VQEEIGKHKGYEYARVSNPTRTRLEENLAALEGGVAAKVFASGMAAINAIVTTLKAGDHLVCGHNLYGGTPRLFNQVWADFGLEFTYVDTRTSRTSNAHSRKTPAWCSSRHRRTRYGVDRHPGVSDVCRPNRIDLAVDNTFMSPYFQQPIALGADLVVHSTTKFLNGHSDGLGESWSATRPEQADKLAFLQKAAGAILSPFECWLILRGVRHSRSAWRNTTRVAGGGAVPGQP